MLFRSGDLANRSISFLVGKWRNNQMSPTKEERLLDSLRRLLLRARTVVEEAEGRHITNMAMLQQLNTLRMEMHTGYYALDRFSCGAPDDGFLLGCAEIANSAYENRCKCKVKHIR